MLSDQISVTMYKNAAGTILLFLLAISYVGGQSALPGADGFPAAWRGVWKGDLLISRAEGPPQRVPMELHILPLADDSTFSWTIYYGADKESGKRDYLLRTVDRGRGIYRIDEQNSIGLEAYLLDQTLYSRFEVMGNLLSTMVELRGDSLFYNIVSGKLSAVSETGNQVIDGETIPPVKAYPLQVQQRAYLRRD